MNAYYAVLLRMLKRDELSCMQPGIREEQSARLGMDSEYPSGGVLWCL